MPLEFCVDDVRELSHEDGSFNFVLFSFNGIDYMDQNDRLKALREIYHVQRAGWHFLLFLTQHVVTQARVRITAGQP